MKKDTADFCTFVFLTAFIDMLFCSVCKILFRRFYGRKKKDGK